jgi:hypothetical protein
VPGSNCRHARLSTVEGELEELERLETADLPAWQAFVNATERSLEALLERTLRVAEQPKLLRYYVNVIAQRFAASAEKLDSSAMHLMILLCNNLSSRASGVLTPEEGENHSDDILNAMRVAILALSRARPTQLLERLSELRIETMACLLRLAVLADKLTEALLERTCSERCDESVYTLAIGALARSAPRRILFREALVCRHPVAIDAIQCIRESAGPMVKPRAENLATEQEMVANERGTGTHRWLDVLSAFARNDYARYALALDTEARLEDIQSFQLNSKAQIRAAFESAQAPLRATAALAAVNALRQGIAQHPSELAVPNSLKPLMIEIIRQTKRDHPERTS